MGPLPGTFDLRSSNSKSWPFSRGKNDKKKMVNSTNATNKQNVNNNNNKVVNNQKSGEATNRPPVTTVVDNDSMALPDVITDKTNTGNQQFRCSPVETPLLQTQLHRSTSSLSTSTSTGSAQTQSQGTHSIVHASVSGFVPIRHRLQEIRDMAYVVDVTWSDGRTHMVKRTFSDFYNFHFYLLDEWGAKECKDGPLRLTFYLPGQFVNPRNQSAKMHVEPRCLPWHIHEEVPQCMRHVTRHHVRPWEGQSVKCESCVGPRFVSVEPNPFWLRANKI